MADYSWALAQALREVATVTVVSAAPAPPAPFATIDVTELRRRPGDFDAVVHCMGNSPYHLPMLELLEEAPGVVLAHEARFTDLWWAHAQAPGRGAAWYRTLLDREHPDKTGAFSPEQGVAAAATAGVYLFGPLIDLATAVLTTNEWAARLAREERPGRAAQVTSVGFGHRVGPPHPIAEVNQVVAVGRQNSTKDLPRLLEAFALVRAALPAMRFAVLGLLEEELKFAAPALAADLGLDEVIEFCGFLEESDYAHRLDRAGLAVQLRAIGNGEMSGAVGDCLGRGIPTLASATEPMLEYPAGVLEVLPMDAGPDTIAAAVVALCGDLPRRRALAERGRRHAAEHGFDRAARDLLAALRLP